MLVAEEGSIGSRGGEYWQQRRGVLAAEQDPVGLLPVTVSVHILQP